MHREYPEAPIVAVGVVVKRGREVLLVRRLNEPSRGRWSLPGGVVELGETVREAARREVREECGLEAEPGDALAVVESIVRDEAGRIRFHYVIIDLLAEYVGGELAPASDIGEARWVREEELAELDVTEKAGQLVREVLSQRSERHSPDSMYFAEIQPAGLRSFSAGSLAPRLPSSAATPPPRS